MSLIWTARPSGASPSCRSADGVSSRVAVLRDRLADAADEVAVRVQGRPAFNTSKAECARYSGAGRYRERITDFSCHVPPENVLRQVY